MPRALTCFLLIACAVLAGVMPAYSADAPDDFATALDEQMPELLTTYGVPGAVVSHIQNGGVAWTRAYGVANVSTGEPMRPDHVLNHGSNGKVLTAWGVMRLVEERKVALDAPVDSYLRRWHLPPSAFDASGVTVRRLLSHTAGLTVHGFASYDVRRPLPSLAEVLDGSNQESGPVTVGWEPGSRIEYSGGGFVVLQMVVEDVTGEPFASYMRHAVLEPLGVMRGGYGWTADLMRAAALGYGTWRDEQPFRNLAAPAIGDYDAPVEDFARLLAAAVPGPNGEPVGRGVLKPETVAEMTTPQPATNGTAGLAYGTGRLADGSAYVTHSGNNLGYFSRFMLSLSTRDGYVVVANSQSADPLNEAVQRIWLETAMGTPVSAPAPAPDRSPLQFLPTVITVLTGLVAAAALLAGVMLARQVAVGRRRWVSPRTADWLGVALLALVALAWWYWFCSALPLPLPPMVDEQTTLYLLRLSRWLLATLWFWPALVQLRRLLPRDGGRRPSTPGPA